MKKNKKLSDFIGGAIVFGIAGDLIAGQDGLVVGIVLGLILAYLVD